MTVSNAARLRTPEVSAPTDLPEKLIRSADRDATVEKSMTDHNTMRPLSSLGGVAHAEFNNRPRQGHKETEACLFAA